jgi:hypothetical protein
MYILKKLNNNRVMKNRLDNYVIPLKNSHLMHVDPKLYIKCPPLGFQYS